MEHHMKYENAIEEYLAWRGDLPFQTVPPGPVDLLIFSVLSYLNFDEMQNGMTLSQALAPLSAEKQHHKPHLVDRNAYLEIGRAAAETVRFGNVTLHSFVNEVDPQADKQFAAVTFRLPGHSMCVTYRGTDNSLVGWKENFQMSFTDGVPAQRRATEYLNEIARRFPSDAIYCAGHSKGGNLAVWAAVHADRPVRRRIRKVMNFDGPGFGDAVVVSSAYQEMIPKVETFVPKSSIVGTLLEHGEPHHIIDSGQVAVMQHDPLSWIIRGGDFVILEERTPFGKQADRILGNWIASMSAQDRRAVTDALFELLEASDHKTLTALTGGGIPSARAILAAFAALEPEKRIVLTAQLSALAAAIRSHPDSSALPDPELP